MAKDRECKYTDTYPPELHPFVPAAMKVFIPGRGPAVICGCYRARNDMILALDCVLKDGQVIRHEQPYLIMFLN